MSVQGCAANNNKATDKGIVYQSASRVTCGTELFEWASAHVSLVINAREWEE